MSDCRAGTRHGAYSACAEEAHCRGDTEISRGGVAVHAGTKCGREGSKLSCDFYIDGGGDRHSTNDARPGGSRKDFEDGRRASDREFLANFFCDYWMIVVIPS